MFSHSTRSTKTSARVRTYVVEHFLPKLHIVLRYSR